MFTNFFKLIPFIFMGFSSGLTIAILSSIDIWLSLNGVSKAIIGLFVFCKIPYTVKFIFVPFIERIQIFKNVPIRKSWILISHTIIFISMIGISFLTPSKDNVLPVFMVCVILMCADGIQNITAYNFQVDRLQDSELGFIASLSTFGYRIGILMSTAGVLLIANSFNWRIAFIVYGVVSFLSSVVFFLRKEPLPNVYMKKGEVINSKFFSGKSFNIAKRIFIKNILIPLRSSVLKNNIIVTMVLLAVLKIPDDMAHKMARLMYLEIGYSVFEIAHYVNNIGFFATVIGGVIAGFWIKKNGVKKSLFWSAFIHAFTFIFYIVVLRLGYNPKILALSIVLENVTGGMLMSSFIAVLYSFCKFAKSPSLMYSFMWCCYNVISITAVSVSGILVENVGWLYFFALMILLTTVGCVLSYLLYFVYNKKYCNFY